MMEYRFGVDEMLTKVSILREEFIHLHQYNPIEHVTSRVKSPEGILEKVVRRGCAPTLEEIRRNITDIAGIRITCSFLKDTYHVLDMITSQHDVRVLAIKDYIKNPKPNGYKSLHAIVELPVYLSEGRFRSSLRCRSAPLPRISGPALNTRSSTSTRRGSRAPAR